MSGANIPVIRLDEKKLRRIKEKREKLESSQKKIRERSNRETLSPKLEFYQAGQSRLSNRATTIKKDHETNDLKTGESQRNVNGKNKLLKTQKTQDFYEGPNYRNGNKPLPKKITKDYDNTYKKPAPKKKVNRKEYSKSRMHDRDFDTENDLEWDSFGSIGQWKKQEDGDTTDLWQPEIEENELHISLDSRVDTEKEQRKLFNPENPLQPIVVKNSRAQDFQEEPQYFSPMYNSATRYLTFPARNESWNQENESHDIGSEYMEILSRDSYLLEQAQTVEAKIALLLSCADFQLDNFKANLEKNRQQLIDAYKPIIVNDLDTSSKKNVEQSLWKNVFHQVIEKLREQISACQEKTDKAELKDFLVLLINQAVQFYESLLAEIQTMYRFNLMEIISDVSRVVNKHAGKRTKLAIMSCQRTLLCLGDLARYRETVLGGSNFGKARQKYIQARALEPRNGRPYNQLAVLAVRTRRRLDAVYYYARSLATTGNPILTARESLIALFDDARRKLDYMTKKEKENVEKEEISNHKSKKYEYLREIWILPDEENTHFHSPNKNNDTEKCSSDTTPAFKGLKHFLLIYVNLHGKLFTRIGFDSFCRLKEEMLEIFNHILFTSPLLISSQTLFHIFAINFFSVFDQQQRMEIGSTQDSCLHSAIELSFDMISLLINRITSLLNLTQLTTTGMCDLSIYPELAVLLPMLKLACDWMYSNKETWYPESKAARNPNIWLSLAKLCDWLLSKKMFPVTLLLDKQPDFKQVYLPEDFEFSGYVPLSEVDSVPRFAHSSDLQTSAPSVLTYVRLELVRDFLEYLCGMEQPLLLFKQGRYVVLVELPITPIPQQTPQPYQLEEECFEDDREEEEDYAPEDEDIYHLKALRDSLQQTKDERDKRKRHIEVALQSSPKMSSVKVKPRHLVVDTNCLIDHLGLLESLLKDGRFIVCVPLVVVVELKGLSQELINHSEHAVKVRSCANVASEFIQTQFNKYSNFQVLTSQGTQLHSISFHDQQRSDKKATNDDLILQCCVKYESKVQRVKAFSSTVLLTDDRNLRVKSLSKNMPTKTVPDFCYWCGLLK